MYCEKCGKKIPEGALECPHCTAVTEPCAVTPSVAKNQFRFSKIKGFSYVRYKEIKTSVRIRQNTLMIQRQTTWFAFWKRPPREDIIFLNQIASVYEKRTWDFWDLFFAAFIAICSRVRSIFWLLFVLLFIWTASGWTIGIQLKDGTIKKIPYSGLQSQSDLVDIITTYLAQQNMDKE